MIDMVCIDPIPPMSSEQVANVSLTVDHEGHVWMTWAHIVQYDESVYGSIKYARLRVI